ATGPVVLVACAVGQAVEGGAGAEPLLAGRAVADAGQAPGVVDLVEAEPVEEDPVDLVPVEHLVDHVEQPVLVVPGARADADEPLELLALPRRRHVEPLGVRVGDRGRDLGEVHAGEQPHTAPACGGEGVPDEVAARPPREVGVAGLERQVRGIVRQDATHVEQPHPGAVLLDRVEGGLDVEVRVDLAQVGLEDAERLVPPARARGRGGVGGLGGDRHRAAVRSAAEPLSSRASATSAEWSRPPSPRCTSDCTSRPTSPVTGSTAPRALAAPSTMPRSLWCSSSRNPGAKSSASTLAALRSMTVLPPRPRAMTDRAVATSASCASRKTTASASACRCVATTSWLAALTVCPDPASPTRTTVVPIAPSRSRQRSTASAGPPTMIDSVPSRAPASPPDTGASSASCPAATKRSAISRAAPGSMVLMSM